MPKPIYKFYLTINGTETPVDPWYTDDLALENEVVSGQEFARKKLSEGVTFLRNDYRTIDSVPYGTEITIRISKTVGTTTTDNWYTGTFTHTKGDWDEDKESVKIASDTVDRYSKLLNNKSRGFTWSDLQPRNTPITFSIPGIVQVYVAGGTSLLSLNEGQQWDADVLEPKTDHQNLVDLGFALASEKYHIAGDANTLSPDVSGPYTRVGGSNGADGVYQSANGLYEVIRILQGSGQTAYNRRYIRRISDGVLLFEGEDFNTWAMDASDLSNLNHNFNKYTGINGSSGVCRMFGAKVYGRVLTNVGVIPNRTVNPRLENDLYEGGERYPFVHWFTGFDFHLSSETNPTEGDFGSVVSDALFKPEEYFIRPQTNLPNLNDQIPVEQFSWTAVSLWLDREQQMVDAINAATDSAPLRYACKLSDVFKAFFAKIDPTIVHEETDVFSAFLYGNTTPIRSGSVLNKPYVVPKRFAIAAAGLTADRQEVSFQDYEELLWNSYQAKWFIDDQNRFRIEHISFFENGGTYDGVNIGVDLTTQLEPKTKKPWAFKTSKWDYDTSDMPETLEVGWMDEVSAHFEGEDIVSVDPIRSIDSSENRSMSKFTTDIDFVVGNSSAVSASGYLVLEVLEVLSSKSVAYRTVTITPGNSFRAQNGALSNRYIHQAYYQHSMPTRSALVNGIVTAAVTVRRTRKQSIGYPEQDAVDLMPLALTNLGAGKITKSSEALTSGNTSIQLKHDAQ
jgi:hypothetical protein